MRVCCVSSLRMCVCRYSDKLMSESWVRNRSCWRSPIVEVLRLLSRRVNSMWGEVELHTVFVDGRLGTPRQCYNGLLQLGLILYWSAGRSFGPCSL